MDKECYQSLEEAALPGICLLTLPHVEDAEILAVKWSRSHGEYCWTLTPVLIARVLEEDHGASFVT